MEKKYAAGNINGDFNSVISFRNFKVMNVKLIINISRREIEFHGRCGVFSGLFDFGITQNNMKNVCYSKKRKAGIIGWVRPEPC